MKNIQETEYIFFVSFNKTASFCKKIVFTGFKQIQSLLIFCFDKNVNNRFFVKTENKQNIMVICFVQFLRSVGRLAYTAVSILPKMYVSHTLPLT